MTASTMMRAFALDHPIATGLILVLAAGVFRVLDIFVLRLDEKWGEIFVSKIIGVLIVLGFLWATGAGLAASGLHTKGIGGSVVLGVGLTVIALFIVLPGRGRGCGRYRGCCRPGRRW